MTKHSVYLTARVTYEVNTASPFTASEKAIAAFLDALPVAGEKEDGVLCVQVLVDQNLPVEELK